MLVVLVSSSTDKNNASISNNGAGMISNKHLVYIFRICAICTIINYGVCQLGGLIN
jgi:hypothetical protein